MTKLQRYYVLDKDNIHLHPPKGTNNFIPVAIHLADEADAVIEQLKARIYELAIQCAKYEHSIVGDNYNQIIADGIEAAMNYASEEKPCVECEYQNFTNYVQYLRVYIAKLREGNDDGSRNE